MSKNRSAAIARADHEDNKTQPTVSPLTVVDKTARHVASRLRRVHWVWFLSVKSFRQCSEHPMAGWFVQICRRF